MNADRRHPIRPFKTHLMQDFLKGREVISFQLFSSGRSNSNYKFVLQSGESYVLRLHGGDKADLESYVMDLVREVVPVPKELSRGEGWSVLSFLEGDLLSNVPQHAGAASEALIKISSAVSFDTSGLINTDGTVSQPSFADQGFVETALEDAEVLQWIGADAAIAMSKVLREQAWRFPEHEDDIRLVHGDFNPTNILIVDGVVSGVLDWEFSHSGSPYEDIGNLLRYLPPDYHSHVKAGLEAGGMELPVDWQELAELKDIDSQFEFLTSNRSDDFKQECVDRILKFIQKYGTT